MATSLRCSERQLLRAVLSPNPRGYVLGAISEILLRDRLRRQGFECHRIVEKPAGGFREKRADVRGDLYVRPRGSKSDGWWVVECKGLKSNAEKHLYASGITRDAAYKYLADRAFPPAGHVRKRYERMRRAHQTARAKFKTAHPGKSFPRLRQDRSAPGSESHDLSGLWRDSDELHAYVRSLPARMLGREFTRGHGVFSILQTHKPSVRKDPRTGKSQAAPLRTDFSVLAVDLFLRTGRHEFVFAAAESLNSSPQSPNHLYQNYTIDVLVPGLKPRPCVQRPWFDSFSSCVARTKPSRRKLDESQLDRRRESLSGFFD
ncbi:MAG: hypothetical protein R3F05_02270 [Planctomycetota bacterium]|nr:hypothetical protein [Planctomycetota bacterium]